MKRLILVLALLAFPVLAQKFTSTIIQPHTTQSTSYTVTSSPTLTTGTDLGGIRVTCTTACYISVASPAVLAIATGIYLPADTPFLITIGPGARVVTVTAATGAAGTISITEF